MSNVHALIAHDTTIVHAKREENVQIIIDTRDGHLYKKVYTPSIGKHVVYGERLADVGSRALSVRV
jgi:hypothetical protein